ncbi:MAG: Gfo/Idh/MocA family oxidoreductase [Candidatus Poribacteria bacterium]|nr:Gfo/Idh/MocA family oxidoreductase [Candidatus Poribacteria bacterium]
MYKCAFLGCGGRARAHAHAYEHVKRGEIVALCDMNEQLLNAFGDDFAIEKRYTDIHEMLDKERPDLLHIVTAPVLRGTNQLIRYPLMNIASEHGVPAAIVEKPIAVMGEDWRQLKELSQNTNTKFAVNTQLNFHPPNLELKRDLAAGRIGDIKFIDASARSTPIDQGPHVLQLVSSYIDNSRPVKVFGQVSGGQHLDSAQPSPDHATASITYANGVRALVTFGTEGAPEISESESVFMHKRVCVFGTRGFVHWWMAGWERGIPESGYEHGEHDYGEQDVLGQAGLTEAMFDWLDDENKVHPTHLPQSLAEFNVILGIYHSALTHAPVELPFDPPAGLIESLKAVLL